MLSSQEDDTHAKNGAQGAQIFHRLELIGLIRGRVSKSTRCPWLPMPKIGERQIITGLGLVLEVLTLAQPSLLEARVRHVLIEKIIRHGGVRVNGQRLIGRLLFPSPAGTFLFFRFRYSLALKEFHKVARIVPAPGLGVD